MKPTLVYQGIQWREVRDEPTEEAMWPRNETYPQPQEARWIRTFWYIDAPIGGVIWLLYQPALSMFNGWVDHPEELDESAIIEVEILELHQPIWAVQEQEKSFSRNPHLTQLSRLPIGTKNRSTIAYINTSPHKWKGWAKVVCRRVVPLDLIPASLPEVPPEESHRLHADSAKEYRGSNMSLHYAQGQETAEWWLITRGPPRHLVLHCVELSGGPIEIWNWLLPI